MGTLEQLMGSRTLGGTIITLGELRIVNLVGVLLLFVWVWSPLGGQAWLRMLTSRLETIRNPSVIIHFDTNSAPQMSRWALDSPHSYSGILNRIALQDSIYNAALLSPNSIQDDTQDLWGNLKIPYLPSYGKTEVQAWQDVSFRPDFHYSALVGIPLTNVLPGNTTFTMESTYVYLDCFNVTRDDWDGKGGQGLIDLNDTAIRQQQFPYESIYSVPNGTWQGNPLNKTDSALTGLSSWTLAIDTLSDQIWSGYELPNENVDYSAQDGPSLFTDETGIEARPTTLLMQVTDGRNDMRPSDHIYAYCSVFQHYVESRVNCSLVGPTARPNCSVIRQRPSQKPHAPEDISFLSFPRVFNKLSLLLPQATHHATSSASVDPTLTHLQNLGIGLPDMLNLQDVPRDIFSYRLGQVINSYLLISQVFPGTLGERDSTFEPNITVPVQRERLVEVYDISTPWASICIFSCLVFLSGGVLSVVLTRLASGPDVLGFVSTIVRDSKHFDLSPEAARMNGVDLTMTMRKMKIRYGFIRQSPEEEGLLGVGREETVYPLKSRM